MKNNYLKNYLKQKLYERVDQIPPEPPEFLERMYPEDHVEAMELPFPGWFGPPGPWSQDVLDRQRDWDPENETLLEFWLISYPWLRRYLNNPQMLEWILQYLRYNGTPGWNESVEIPWHIRNNPRWPWYRYMA
jgi:hypothetical protein